MNIQKRLKPRGGINEFTEGSAQLQAGHGAQAAQGGHTTVA